MFAAADGDTMKVMEGCANIGGDTDTFACVAGMIAGAFNGCSGVKPELMEQFKQVNQHINFEELADGLTRIAEERR